MRVQTRGSQRVTFAERILKRFTMTLYCEALDPGAYVQSRQAQRGTFLPCSDLLNEAGCRVRYCHFRLLGHLSLQKPSVDLNQNLRFVASLSQDDMESTTKPPILLLHSYLSFPSRENGDRHSLFAGASGCTSIVKHHVTLPKPLTLRYHRCDVTKPGFVARYMHHASSELFLCKFRIFLLPLFIEGQPSIYSRKNR